MLLADGGAHLILVGALLQLFELGFQHGELARHALNAGVQGPVLVILHIELVLVPLTLLMGNNRSVAPTEIPTHTHTEKNTELLPDMHIG